MHEIRIKTDGFDTDGVMKEYASQCPDHLEREFGPCESVGDTLGDLVEHACPRPLQVLAHAVLVASEHRGRLDDAEIDQASADFVTAADRLVKAWRYQDKGETSDEEL